MRPVLLNHQSELTADHACVSADQLESEIAEVCTFIGSVRDELGFTTARAIRIWAPAMGLFMLGLAGIMLFKGESPGAGVFATLIGLMLIATGWSNRHAGRDVFMRLTRKSLWVHNLSAPISLLDITGVSVTDDWIMTVRLHLREGATLPARKSRRALFAAQGRVERIDGSRIGIRSPGLMVDEQKLSGECAMRTFDLYIRVARAEQRLQTLLARQAQQRRGTARRLRLVEPA
jgi:hypothetical protein